MTDCANTKPRWVHRIKWTQTDGIEREHAYIRDTFGSVDELEALGHEALQVAAEWRQEIAERIPTPPTYKAFAFSCNGRETKIASWVEHPWVLARRQRHVNRLPGQRTKRLWLVSGPDRRGREECRRHAAAVEASI